MIPRAHAPLSLLAGPLSLAALERDEFRRVTDGYAPSSELLFLDEIYKSNSAILNTLLTLLNERLFDDGADRVRVPLLSAVAASNEGPESDELAALHDRFLLRKLVSPVSDDGVLELLLGSGAGEGEEVGKREGVKGEEEEEEDCSVIAAASLRQALADVREAAPTVSLPRWAALLLRDARSYIRELSAEGVGGGYISDRRLRRAAELLKASAAAHGRQSVSTVDVLAVLPHVLWEDEEEARALDEWVKANALPEGGAEQIGFLLSSVRARTIAAAAAATAAAAGSDGGGGGGEGEVGDTDSLLADASALTSAAVEAAAEMRAHQAALETASSHLFLPPAAAAAGTQALLPLAHARCGELEQLAVEAVRLQIALEQGLAADLIDALADEEVHSDSDSDPGGGGEGPPAAAEFTPEELAWGRKEAKARLGPEEFKAWRKAAKKAAKSKQDDAE